MSGINTAEFTGIDVQELTDFSSDVDLVSLGPTGETPRIVIVLDAGGGNLTVTTAHGTRPLPASLLVGIQIVCGIETITSATDVGSVLVIW